MATTDEVKNRIMDAGIIPTRQDLTDLLASIAPPGEKRAEKDQAVLDIFAELGHTPNNSQGHSVLLTLDGYEAY